MGYSINIFTINGCSHCKVLKEELSKQGIEYDEFEVNKNRKIYDEVIKLTNLDALPTVYLQDPQTLSGPIFVAGRDFNTKEEAIEKIKKYL
jgi:glutaredoxin